MFVIVIYETNKIGTITGVEETYGMFHSELECRNFMFTVFQSKEIYPRWDMLRVISKEVMLEEVMLVPDNITEEEWKVVLAREEQV